MREQNKKYVVAVYMRVGNASQIDAEQHQAERLRQLAAECGWHVTGEFFDSCHGRGVERPCLNAMLEHITQGKAEAVLALNEGRIGRGVCVVEEIERKIQARGGRVFYADRLQSVLSQTALRKKQGPTKACGTKRAKYSVHPKH